MNKKKKLLISISVLLIAVVPILLVLKDIVAPGLARRRLIAAVSGSCETCSLALGGVKVSLLPPALSAVNVVLSGGNKSSTFIRAEAESVSVPLAILPLLKGRVRAGRIVIEHPAVTVTEGDLKATPLTKEGGGRPIDVEIAGFEVKQASFTYIREHAGRKAVIFASRINCSAGPAGNTTRFSGKYVEASAVGLLEGSGQFRLGVKAKPFSEVPEADVKLQIAGQHLAELNRIFGPNDGVELKGELIEADSSVSIRGKRLNSAVYVRYSGLVVKLKKNSERSAVAAFFQNLVASVVMKKQNAPGGHYDRRATAELERKQDETVISFILRGMKEGAVKVASQGGD